MKKNKRFKDLGVAEKMKLSEGLGAKCAIIVNKVREKCNKILLPIGHGVNISIEFYKLNDLPDQIPTNEEVTSG